MKEMTCAACPKGCKLRVDSDLYEVSVSGNECAVGRDYAVGEYTNPVRTATFNVRVRGGSAAVVSAITARPISLVKILPASRLLKKLYVDAPIKEGQILFSSLLGEKIIATSSVGKVEKYE